MSTQKISSWFAYPVLICLLVASFIFMLTSALHDSAITDELAHIPAGYSYVHNLDGRLNPEHPPLLKMIAELPVLFFLNPTFPTNVSSWNDVNGQWDIGTKFLYESGNNADSIIRLSRIGPILLTILLILFTYFWSRRLLGNIWALVPTSLIALSPTILAHGHYVTTDIAAAFGVIFATYFFVRQLQNPSPKNILFAGIAFGVAQAMKFSAVLLLPYFLLLIIMSALLSSSLRLFAKKFLHFVSIVVIGYIVIIYPLYTLLTIHYPPTKQTADTQFILTSFAGGPPALNTPCHIMRCVAETDIWMTKHTLTRPFAQYLLGVLMVLQRSDGGNTGYFLGQVSAAGSRLYFPIVYLLKEPIPILIIVLGAILIGIVKSLRAFRRSKGNRVRSLKNFLSSHFPEASMGLFVLIYWGWSMKSPLNIGVRHLIPTFPFLAILATSIWKNARSSHVAGLGYYQMTVSFIASHIKRFFTAFAKYMLFVVLLFWLLLEAAFASPYFLSYFNKFGGGTYGGYRYVTDSNYDWGQDLLRLKEWIENNRSSITGKIAVDYFGGGNPKYYLGDHIEYWWSSRGNPLTAPKTSPQDSEIEWFAISINSLEGALGKTAPGFERKPEDEYRWLSDARGVGPHTVPKPDFRIGTSIFVYHLK